MKFITFLRQFMLHPKQTGAILSSSSKLCRTLVQEAKVDQAKLILEFGTGIGDVTEKICLQKDNNSKLLGLEINKVFAEETIKRCPEADIINCCVTNAKEILKQKQLDYSDCIISSLPWSFLPEHYQDRILETVIDVLRPGGIFVTFVYLHCLPLRSIHCFFDKLEKSFYYVEHRPVIWLNVPPAVVYISIK